MTANRILDAFSESLMQDERILNPRERELLASLLQTAKNASYGNQEVQAAVSTTIARAVGETVVQRTFTLLGGSIVEQILARSTGSSSFSKEEPNNHGVIFSGPEPPTQSPQPPSEGDDDTEESPVEPSKGPEPPNNVSLKGQGSTTDEATRPIPSTQSGAVGVLDAPRAQCIVLDEFLAPQELEQLIGYVLEREKEFRTSEVISPRKGGIANYDHRRSRVLMDAGPHEEVILNRIRRVLPGVLEQLGIEEFPLAQTEVQITASNDGDFFRAHCDNAQQKVASRRVTFVYFFHRDPSQFEGGELWLHDSRDGRHPSGAGSYERIIPQQNQIVFFPCSTLHEITPVQCSSRAFADSRFTVNGWLHR
jgi:SM-20-related protein